MDEPVDAAFTKALPKIEVRPRAILISGLDYEDHTADFLWKLHAHLTGSITRQCLHEIWSDTKERTPGFLLEDPLLAIPLGKVDFDVNT